LSVRTSGELDKRLLAGIVAENIAVDTVTRAVETLDPVSSGQERQRNRIFVWTRTIEGTPRAGLYSIRIAVSEPDSETVLVRLSTLTRSGGAQ
jgi:general secretion pathway protein I